MKINKLWIIIAITVLNAVGMTIVFPLFPFLVGQYLPPTQVAIGLSLLVSAYAACQFFAAPVFGALSDRFGRIPILLISLLGSVIGYVLLGIGGALWVLFLGRIIDGLTAGNISALFAYVTDSTDEKDRTKWFSYIGAAIGIGFMIGPAIGGLLGSSSISLPFFVAAGITLLSAIGMYAFLPESLPAEKRSTDFSLKSLNTFGHFKDIFALKEARLLLILGFFFYVGLTFYQFNFSIFVKDVFAWGPAQIGGVLTLVGLCDILSRSVILPQLLKRVSERAIGMAGLGGLSLGLGMLFASAFFHSIPMVFAAVACITLGEGFFDPPYNSLLSRSVDDSKQGQLQGANQSLQAAYHALVPLIAGGIYSFAPSGVFAVAALLMVCGLVLYRSK